LAQNNQDLNQFITQKLVEADIPLAKLDYSLFRELLETLSGKALPRANTLRSHLTPTYDMVIEKVRKFIGDNDIYLIIDETTDKLVRFLQRNGWSTQWLCS